jgi:hypothetical protein
VRRASVAGKSSRRWIYEAEAITITHRTNDPLPMLCILVMEVLVLGKCCSHCLCGDFAFDSVTTALHTSNGKDQGIAFKVDLELARNALEAYPMFAWINTYDATSLN